MPYQTDKDFEVIIRMGDKKENFFVNSEDLEYFKTKDFNDSVVFFFNLLREDYEDKN